MRWQHTFFVVGHGSLQLALPCAVIRQFTFSSACARRLALMSFRQTDPMFGSQWRKAAGRWVRDLMQQFSAGPCVQQLALLAAQATGMPHSPCQPPTVSVGSSGAKCHQQQLERHDSCEHTPVVFGGVAGVGSRCTFLMLAGGPLGYGLQRRSQPRLRWGHSSGVGLAQDPAQSFVERKNLLYQSGMTGISIRHEAASVTRMACRFLNCIWQIYWQFAHSTQCCVRQG